MKKTGEKQNWFMKHKVLTGVIVVVVLIAVIAALSGGGTDMNTNNLNTNNNTDSSQPNEQEDEGGFAAGTYKIGEDMPAGEYRLVATGSNGYFQLDSDSTGALESIVANDNFATNSILTVADGQYLKLQNTRAYPIDESPEVDTKQEGMFKVGKDIEAGEYKVTSEGMGYVQVSSDSTHSLDTIVTNDNFEGDKYITVTDGQYLKLTRAKIAE